MAVPYASFTDRGSQATLQLHFRETEKHRQLKRKLIYTVEPKWSTVFFRPLVS